MDRSILLLCLAAAGAASCASVAPVQDDAVAESTVDRAESGAAPVEGVHALEGAEAGAVAQPAGFTTEPGAPALSEPVAEAQDEAAGAAAEVVQTVVAESTPARDFGPGSDRFAALQQDILSSEEFAEAFARSYLSIHDVEPTVSLDDREVLLEIGEALADTPRNLDRAMRLAQRERGRSGNEIFDYTVGNLHLEQGNIEEARESLELAVAKNPSFVRAWTQLGFLHFQNSDYENMIRPFSKVIELGRGDGRMFGLLGVGYATRGDFIAAESAYRMAMLLEPDRIEWKMALAEAFLKQSRYGETVALLEGMIAADPSDPMFWRLQASAYLGLEQHERAAENYEILHRIGGATTDTMFNLGDLYLRQELFDLAVVSYVHAMEMDPELTAERPLASAEIVAAFQAYEDLAVLLEAIEGRFAGALDTEQQKDILKLRARMAVEEGLDEQQKELLEEIVALDPLDGEAIILLGQHYADNGEVEQAMFRFGQAAALDDHVADARLAQAQLHVQLGELDKAVEQLRASLDAEERPHVRDYFERVRRASQGR